MRYIKAAEYMVSSSDALRDVPPEIIAGALECNTIEYWRLGAALHRIEIIAGEQTDCGNLTFNDGSPTLGLDYSRVGVVTSPQLQVAQASGVLRQLRRILSEDPGAELIVITSNKLITRN